MNQIRRSIESYLVDIGSKAGITRYFQNTIWLFSEKITRVLLGLCIGIWVARYLGPAEFGLLNYAISFVVLLSAPSALGLDNVVVKELTEASHSEYRLMGTAFGLKVFGSVSTFTLIIFVSYFINKAPQTHTTTLIVACSLLFHPFNVIEFFFRSRVRSQFWALSSIIALIFGAALRVYLIQSQRDVFYFAGALAFEYLITGIALLFFYRYSNRSFFKWRFDGAIAKNLLNQSWPLLFSAIMISIYMRIDQVMIQKMLGEQSVGYYAAAVRISEAWYFVPLVICQSIFPSVVNAKSNDESRYDIRMQKLYELIVLVCLVISLPIFLLSTVIIPFLFGAAYTPAGPALQYHIWAGLFVGIGLASSNWLLVENLQRYQMFNLACGAILNIVLNVFLIEKLNIKGAAIATFLSYFYSSYFALLLFSKTRPCFIGLTKAIFLYRLFAKFMAAK